MSADPTTATANAFAAERTRLLGIAYRMLGSRADAEFLNVLLDRLERAAMVLDQRRMRCTAGQSFECERT